MLFIINWILYIPHLLAAVYHVIHYIWTSCILQVPCSYPGDPIKKQLTRRGEWPKRDAIPVAAGWKFAVDQESHEVTLAANPGTRLTGESAGRQVCYFDDKEGTKRGKGKDKGAEKERDSHFSAAENCNSGDKLFRSFMLRRWKGAVPDTNSRPATAKEAASKGLGFYQMLQCEDGHWAGDYGGPMFLLPGLVISIYITKVDFAQCKKDAIITMLRNHQQVDGGWGTHIECASTMFGTVGSYVALRLLGAPADADYMREAHAFMMRHGGALYAPSWCKFWLAALGVYDWKGTNSIPAEMFLLPRWFPFHPGKLWCHARMVYLPMCYVFCTRFTPPDLEQDPLLMALRRELYAESYDSIDFDAYRQTCAEIDEYSALNPVMKVAQDFCAVYENYLLPNVPFLRWMRRKALEFVIEYIHAEDAQTNYVCIGPVNKALNMLAVFVDGGMSTKTEAFQRHVPRIDDYLWVAEDGMKMQGYNGSQCWDTSFAVQAIIEGGLAEEYPECAQKVYHYLKRTQIANDEDNRERYFRHVSKGGWPFSTAAHGWPISDCTAEGLKGVLTLHSLRRTDIVPDELRIPDHRLHDACDILLSYHNTDGGWATYENNRGSRWYEMMNPSEVFGDIMIDYSYVECTSACVTALVGFQQELPLYRAAEVEGAIQAGRAFVKTIQREDGSWYGSWAVCFCYGTWFGIECLVAAGERREESLPLQKALSYLLSKQNANGGWGESYVACVNKIYPHDGVGAGFGEDGSGVVQTAWALLGLMAGDCKDRDAIDRGVAFLMRKQLPSGDWDQEGITGVFNRSCGITYTAYRNVFPIWALSRYGKKYDTDSR